jgi:hypothetical protein
MSPPSCLTRGTVKWGERRSFLLNGGAAHDPFRRYSAAPWEGNEFSKTKDLFECETEQKILQQVLLSASVSE